MYGDESISPSFYASLVRSIVPEYGRGGNVTPTYTRATTATQHDFEGRIIPVASGQARTEGARVVTNAIANASSASLAVAATDTITVAADTVWVFSMGPGSGTVTFTGTATGSSGTLTADASNRTAKTLTITGAGTIIMTASVAPVVDYQIENVTGQTNQNPSEYVSKGVLSSPYHGLGADGAKAFTYLNGNTVSDGVVTEATGPAISSSTSKWVELDGVTGTYVSTPDSAAASVTGDITLIAWVAMDDWTPAASMTVVSKFGADPQNSYLLQVLIDGTLRINWSEDGTTSKTVDSSASTGFADGTGHWIGVTLDVDNGASGHDVTFWVSDDLPSTSPSQVSLAELEATTTTAGTTSIYDGTAPVNIGSSIAGTSALLSGKVSRALVIASTDPTADPVVDFNANDYEAGRTLKSTTGEVWTLQGAANVFGPLSRNIDVDGSSDGWTSPDSAAASITGDIFLAGWGAADDWAPTDNIFISAKYESTSDQRSYGLAITGASSGTAGTFRLVTSPDGTSGNQIVSASTAAPGYSNGTLQGFAVSVDISAETATFYTTTSSPWTPHNKVIWEPYETVAHVTTGIYDSTALITVGGNQDDLTSGAWSGRIMRAYAIASTDPTVAPAWDFDARALTPGVTTGTMSTSEVWTAVGNGTIEQNIPAPWGADGPYGYLSEGARTNLGTYSNDLSQWSNTNTTDTQNSAVTPDGTTTANQVVETTASASHVAAMPSISFANATAYTYSQYLKAGSVDWVQVVLPSGAFGAGAWANFNLSSGAVGSNIGADATAKIQDVGNGWYRCSVTATSTAAATSSPSVAFTNNVDAASRLPQYVGSTSSNFLVFGAQVEAGSFPSSYIPTTSTAVTRNADAGDTYSAVGNADSFPQTMTLEYTPNQITQVGYLVSVDDDSANNRAEIYVDASGKPVLRVVSGGTTTATITSSGSALVAGTTYRITGVIGANDAELYVDGTSVGTDTSVTVPVSPTVLRVGQDYNGANQPYGSVRLLRDFNKRLNDTQVASL